MSFSGEIIHRGEFVKIPIQNSFYLYCFLFSVPILHVELLRVFVQSKFSPGLSSLEEISVRKARAYLFTMLKKWLSQNFDRIILGKNVGWDVEGYLPSSFLSYLDKRIEILISDKMSPLLIF